MLILLQIILAISYLIRKYQIYSRYWTILCLSYLLYNIIHIILLEVLPTVLIACAILFCLKFISILLGNTQLNVHWIFKVLCGIIIIFFIYACLLSYTILLAEELKELDICLQLKVDIFCKQFKKYLENLGVSIEDRQLFYSALVQNKKILYNTLENLNTIEKIHVYARFVVDETLEHWKRRKIMDDRVLFFLQHALVAYLSYIKELKSSTLLLITYPKKAITEVLAWIWESIIKFLFGLF